MNVWNDSVKIFICIYSIKIFEIMIIGFNRIVVFLRFLEIFKVLINDVKMFIKLGYLCNLYKIKKIYKMYIILICL